MKKISILICTTLLLVSCENTWDSEARRLFKEGCMKAAQKDSMAEDKAKEMCECRLEKAMEKHPNFADAMSNIQDIINDPAMKDCEPTQ